MTKKKTSSSRSSAKAPKARRGGPTGKAMLFEIAWEVCQQVGGIYTVIRTKAPAMTEQWGKRYCLIGPYNPETSPLEFEEHRASGAIGAALEQLREEGFAVHYGRWLITGRPRTILLDPRSAIGRLGDIKRAFLEHHGIAAPAAHSLIDPALAFGFLVERFFAALSAQRSLRYSLVAHFHEWLGSTAVPELRRTALPISLVFTTHATMLGRYLAHQDPWFYDHLPFVDWLKDARRLDIEPQVRLERAAAHGAHVLTTVGQPAAEECKHLLGREADLLTPNGLNIKRYEVMHEFQNLHRTYKEKIHQFVMAHFFPNYSFDLERTLLFFSAGRYEYRNKGYDLTLEALARLNTMLRAEGIDRTVVFFLITRRPYRSILPDVLRRRAMLEEIRRNCDEIQAEFGRRLFEATAQREDPDYNTLIDDYWKLRLQRLMHAWSARSLPTVVTHELLDDAEDDVLKQVRYLNLVNGPEDRVKIVYHPEFVSSTDVLFGMDYDHFVRGCHLGIFPSFYEPWGYTPLECVARGIPTVTSDLSGFGAHLLQAAPDNNWRGVLVIRRRLKPFEDAAKQLAEALLRFCRQERRERIEMRNTVEGYAGQFDWKVLGEYYAAAHQLARERSGR